jgi:translocation and assembly module TamB
VGAVNLKATAQINNLTVARPGASGSVAFKGSASQSRVGRPWDIALEAQGDRFALGFAEMDRLLGSKPRLEARAAWLAGRLEVSRARLDGAALNATATGALGAAGTLGFRTDWSASGPFRAGPVEVLGRARGDGDITGDLVSPRLTLTADLEQIDVPRLPMRNGKLNLVFQRQADGSNGSVSLTAESAYGPARAGSDFSFAPGGVDLSDLVIARPRRLTSRLISGQAPCWMRAG